MESISIISGLTEYQGNRSTSKYLGNILITLPMFFCYLYKQSMFS